MKGATNGELVKINDITQVGIIAAYHVQKLGAPTLEEIRANAREKMRCVMHPKTLERALRGLSKRGIVAVGQRQLESGVTAKVYEMKTMAYKQPPEWAHVNDLLPKLVTSVEAQALKEWFDKGEEASGGEEKKQRGNIIDDFRHYLVKIVTTDPLLGSQIPCDYTSAVRKKHPTHIEKQEIEVEGIWERDPTTGHYVLQSDVLQGWFGTNVIRYVGLAAARANYVSFNPVHIDPKDVVVKQLVLPVNNQRQGPAAPKAYEALIPPIELEIRFTAPVKGFLEPEQLEKFFLWAGLNPLRGISPARGKRYGHFLVTSFQQLGKLTSGGNFDFLLDGLPSAIREKYGDYAEQALKRLKDVSVTGPSKGKGGLTDDDLPPTMIADAE